MFEIGGFKARHCQGVSRRAFLRAGMSLPAALGVSGALSGTRAAELESSNGKAKSVLLVWLWGGPSHLDMFDPKPEALLFSLVGAPPLGGNLFVLNRRCACSR